MFLGIIFTFFSSNETNKRRIMEIFYLFIDKAKVHKKNEKIAT